MHRKEDDDDGNVYTMKLDGNNPLKIVFLCASFISRRSCMRVEWSPLTGSEKGKQMENSNIKYCVASINIQKSHGIKKYINSS